MTSDIHLAWESCKELANGAAITSSIDFTGSRKDFIALCDELPGLAASAFVRSFEAVTIAAAGDKAEK